ADPFEPGCFNKPSGMIAGRIDKGAAQTWFHRLGTTPVLEILISTSAALAFITWTKAEVGAQYDRVKPGTQRFVKASTTFSVFTIQYGTSLQRGGLFEPAGSVGIGKFMLLVFHHIARVIDEQGIG